MACVSAPMAIRPLMTLPGEGQSVAALCKQTLIVGIHHVESVVCYDEDNVGSKLHPFLHTSADLQNGTPRHEKGKLERFQKDSTCSQSLALRLNPRFTTRVCVGRISSRHLVASLRTKGREGQMAYTEGTCATHQISSSLRWPPSKVKVTELPRRASKSPEHRRLSVNTLVRPGTYAGRERNQITNWQQCLLSRLHQRISPSSACSRLNQGRRYSRSVLATDS